MYKGCESEVNVGGNQGASHVGDGQCHHTRGDLKENGNEEGNESEGCDDGRESSQGSFVEIMGKG